MAARIKNSSLLKTIALIIAFMVFACIDGTRVYSKPAMNSSADAADRSMGINGYQRVNPAGELLNKIKPPATISNHEIISLKDDQSCGSAALASILRYTFHTDIDEEAVITGLLLHGDKESITMKGAFSFYDMKCFLATMGYTGTGYKIDDRLSFKQFNEDGFKSIGNTTIIPIDINGYSHLTVFRAYDDKYIYLGSPFYGNICVTFEDLNKVIIKNSIFTIRKHKSDKSLPQ